MIRQYPRAVMARAGEAPEVVLEAAYGWYWAADVLAGLGARVHLAHPLGAGDVLLSAGQK
jgi:pheromone shutdown protein TraB